MFLSNRSLELLREPINENSDAFKSLATVDQMNGPISLSVRELLPVGSDVDGWDGHGRSALWHGKGRAYKKRSRLAF